VNRPDKWNPPYKPDGEKDERYGDLGAIDLDTFEEGADAMLSHGEFFPNSRDEPKALICQIPEGYDAYVIMIKREAR